MAYTPSASYVFEQTTKNHGSGVYQIIQDVSFSQGSSSVIFREDWIVENENAMHVTVTAQNEWKNQVHFSFLYRGGLKQFIDHNNKRSSSPINKEHLERFFHFRSSTQLIDNLIAQRIVSASIKNPPIWKTEKLAPNNYIQPQVRYSRVAGVVNYAFGNPTPVDQNLSPGIWIDQDQFNIRKIRTQSGVEVLALNYKQFEDNLFFPSLREVKLNSNEEEQVIRIQLVSVKKLDQKNPITERLSPKLLEKKNETSILHLLPNKETIRNFYSRAR